MLSEYLSGSDEQDNKVFIASRTFCYQSQAHKTFTTTTNNSTFDTFKKINHQIGIKLAC